jgi:RNA polymerase sigma-70 factor (ECF subfamily)
MVALEQKQWLAAARAGSNEALGQALEASRRYLLQIANQLLDTDLQAKGGASDLVQEAFLEAHRDFAQFQGNSEAEFRAWLRQLLRHRLAKLARRFRGVQKRRLVREIPLAGNDSGSGRENGLRACITSPSGQAMEHEQMLALRRALDQLPDDYRQVILLRYQDERSWEEIGQLMQRSANAVRLLWLRGIKRLQHELGLCHES